MRSNSSSSAAILLGLQGASQPSDTQISLALQDDTSHTSPLQIQTDDLSSSQIESPSALSSLAEKYSNASQSLSSHSVLVNNVEDSKGGDTSTTSLNMSGSFATTTSQPASELQQVELGNLGVNTATASPPPSSAGRVEKCWSSLKCCLRCFDPCFSPRCKAVCATILRIIKKTLPIAGLLASLPSFITLLATRDLANDDNKGSIGVCATVLGGSLQVLFDEYCQNWHKTKRLLKSLEKHIGSEIILYDLIAQTFTPLEAPLLFTYMTFRGGMRLAQKFFGPNNQTDIETDYAEAIAFKAYLQKQKKNLAAAIILGVGSLILGYSSAFITKHIWEGMPGLFFRWFGFASLGVVPGILMYKTLTEYKDLHKFLQKIFSVTQYFAINPGDTFPFIIRAIYAGFNYGYTNVMRNDYITFRRKQISKQISIISKLSPKLISAINTKLKDFQTNRAFRLCWNNAGKKGYRSSIAIGTTLLAAAPFIFAYVMNPMNVAMSFAKSLPIYLIPLSYFIAKYSEIKPVDDQLQSSGSKTFSGPRHLLNYLFNENPIVFGAIYCYFLRMNYLFRAVNVGPDSYDRGFYTLPFVYGSFFILYGMSIARLKYRQPYLKKDDLNKLNEQEISLTEAQAEFIRDIVQYDQQKSLKSKSTNIAPINQPAESTHEQELNTIASIAPTVLTNPTLNIDEVKSSSITEEPKVTITKNKLTSPASNFVGGTFANTTQLRAVGAAGAILVRGQILENSACADAALCTLAR